MPRNKKGEPSKRDKNPILGRIPVTPMPISPSFGRRMFMLAFRGDITIRLFIRWIEEALPGENLSFIKTAGGITFILAGLSLMDNHFEIGIGLVYLGCFLCLLEVINEPKLKHSPYWRLALIMSIFAGAWFFTDKVVFVSAPLNIDAYIKPGDYPSGTEIGGLKWIRGATDLRVELVNNSDLNYTDVDLQVDADMAIDAYVQISKIPNVNFIRLPLDSGLENLPDAVPTEDGTEMPVTGSDPWTKSIRIRCSTIPRHSAVQIMILTVNEQEVRLTTGSDGKQHLLNSPLGEQKNPNLIKISGEYTAALRVRRLNLQQSPVPIRYPSL